MHGEYLTPHEFDVNFRFNIGDPHFRGTLTLGWAKYTESDLNYDHLLWSDNCAISPLTYHSIVNDQFAYRFNPGIEYTMQSKGKFAYGAGVGIFYYGTLKGNRVTTDFGIYQHQDSLTGECVEDSSFAYISTGRASAHAVQLVGASAHVYASYEVVTGISLFATVSVSPMFSTTGHNFALAPGAGAGVYFRFRSPGTTPH